MPRKISEERTRKELNAPQLEKVGWYLRDHVEGLAVVEAKKTAQK